MATLIALINHRWQLNITRALNCLRSIVVLGSLKLWEEVVRKVLVKRVAESAAGRAREKGDAIATAARIQTQIANEDAIKRTLIS